MTPARLIADNLAALPHPDGTPRQLAGFSTRLLPDAMRDQVDQAAVQIGEAIVHLLETNGYRITSGDEPAPESADNAANPDVAHLHCINCDKRLLSINLTNPEHSLTNGRLLLSGLAALSPECPHDAV